MFKNFSDLNDAIASFSDKRTQTILSQCLSLIKSFVAQVSQLPATYARLYAQIQQLKYDPTTGDVTDVTPADQSTVPESAIANAKTEALRMQESISAIVGDQTIDAQITVPAQARLQVSGYDITLDDDGTCTIIYDDVTYSVGTWVGMIITSGTNWNSSSAVGFTGPYKLIAGQHILYVLHYLDSSGKFRIATSTNQLDWRIYEHSSTQTGSATSVDNKLNSVLNSVFGLSASWYAINIYQSQLNAQSLGNYISSVDDYAITITGDDHGSAAVPLVDLLPDTSSIITALSAL